MDEIGERSFHNELFAKIDQANLLPLESSKINFAYNSQENIDFRKSRSLSFCATDLLNLKPDEILTISKKIRLLFTKIASKNNLKIDKKDLEQFREGDVNPLIHELEHLKKIQEFRPEVIMDSSFNILPVLHAGQLKIGMNVTIPLPNNEYTVLEKVLILLAPNLPSPQDYFGLSKYMKTHQPTKEDLNKIKEIITQKRSVPGKDYFIKFLANFKIS